MLAALALACASAAGSESFDYDVVVYGSSPAGIGAATAAGRLGLRVAVFEPLKMIGGMGAAGNLALHDGNEELNKRLTGIAWEFSMLNAEYYNVTHPVPQPESFVAEASIYKLLNGAGVAKIG
eukprot:Hpha_TRINITY_DN20201_c0_g1::TRINITY_DN20201_c0_g1_i1::g.168252::m.168252